MNDSLPDGPGIYLIRNTGNGKVYIGQSVNIAKRWLSHRWGSQKTHLKRAFAKYGREAFEVEVLELALEGEGLDEREQYWLDRYEAYNPEVGYNIRRIAESNRGITHSPETRVRISAALAGRAHSDAHNARVSAAKRGVKRSPFSVEWRKRLGDAQRGKPKVKSGLPRKPSVAGLKSVEQIDPVTGVIVAVWAGMGMAARGSGVSRTSISLCCRGGQRSAGAWQWRYSGDTSPRESGPVGRRAPKSAEHRRKIGDGNRVAWARRRAARMDSETPEATDE